jgi:hypothetical protein
VTQLVETLRSKSEGRGFHSQCHWVLFNDKSFSVMVLGSNGNDYQEHVLGVKVAGE